MTRMTGAEALVKSLYREGVRVVFTLPGAQLYATYAALREEPGIRLITTRHEQATAYMAYGYARAGGGFGTALVVPGPGLLNTAGALSTASIACLPKAFPKAILAVLRPTPGSLTSSSIVLGTAPPCLSTIALQHPITLRALLL